MHKNKRTVLNFLSIACAVFLALCMTGHGVPAYVSNSRTTGFIPIQAVSSTGNTGTVRSPQGADVPGENYVRPFLESHALPVNAGSRQSVLNTTQSQTSCIQESAFACINNSYGDTDEDNNPDVHGPRVPSVSDAWSRSEQDLINEVMEYTMNRTAHEWGLLKC